MADTENLNPAFWRQLQQLIQAVPGVSVKSGYRSVERQEVLWKQAVDKYGDEEIADDWVARPGQSNHNRGLAADLEFESPEARQRVHAIAAQFGLHFPMEHESWHVEPAGAKDDAPRGAYTTPPEGHQHPQDRPASIDEMLASVMVSFLAPDSTTPVDGAVAPTTEIGVPTGDATPAAVDSVERFMQAIQGVESGGDPQVTNERTGAHGLFQIMPGNWPAWSKEVFGQEAPKTAENQRAVAKHKMKQYRSQFGSWEAAAVAWFAGPGRAQRYVEGDRSVLELSDGNLTVGEYVNRVKAGMS